MSSLLNATQITAATGAAYNSFDSYARYIAIFREPVRQVTVDNTQYAGYGESTQDFEYTPVSGVFLAQINHGNQSIKQTVSVPVGIPDGKTRIKVREDARNFINGGAVMNILVDGNLFNLSSDDGVRNYLGLQRWQYTLERVK